MTVWAVALHGGAGVKPDRVYDRAEAFLAQLVVHASRGLAGGATALDVVEDAVALMESSGLFVAGRGSGPNTLGEVEMDAGLMDGATGRAGAVAALGGYQNPIRAARAVMDRTSHVLLTGHGAACFARDEGLIDIDDPRRWFTRPDGFHPADLADGHGTVGAVALSLDGRLAAATSTGGIYGARPGRVGDSPMPGAGYWADDRIAVSTTGLGEAFLNTAAAHDLAARVRYLEQDTDQAARAVLDGVARLGGDGGLIAVDRGGALTLAFNSPGMKRASAGSGRPPTVGSVGHVLHRVSERGERL